MADFQTAVAITLQNEGGFYHNPVTGEVVNHGITLALVTSNGYKPDADVAFIQNLSVAEATQIYQTYFWDLYHIGSINDQSLANKTFDLTVNMGPGNKNKQGALTLLQSAVNSCGGKCDVDGILGPISIGQINALDPATLLTTYRQLAAQHYTAIAQGNQELAGDLTGWLARLNA